MPDTVPLHARQQKHRRVPCEARVVRYDGATGEWCSLNMSAGGMFVTGTPLLAPGTEIEVGVWVPDGDGAHEIVTRSRVVWTNDPANQLFGDVPAGMGMELVGLSDDDRSALRTLLYGDADDGELLRAEDVTELGGEIGPYRVLDLIGSGGMGDVFLAEHMRLGRRVALKRLNHHLARDPRAARRFFDEGRLINRLEHENILKIMDFIREGSEHYYVMELLEGHNLGEVLDDGPLPLERALRIGAQLCDAVQAVHDAGIVHRDVKPSNVLLIDRYGTRDFVKLLDFGVAKLRGPDPERRPGVAIGTPAYMAPEQCLGEEPDFRADIYALGAVLFHMLTGRLVFEADTLSQMLVKQVNARPPRPTRVAAVVLPRRLERVVLRCLRKSAWRRPASASALGVELRTILAEIDPTATFPALAAASTTPPLRPAAMVAAGALAAAVAALVTVSLMNTDAPRVALAALIAPQVEMPPATAPPEDPSAQGDTVARTATHATRPRARTRKLSDSQVTAMLRTATSHVRQSDPLAAVRVCRDVIRHRPRSALAHRTLGIAYSLLRANQHACAAYRRYLLLAPHAADRERVLDITEACP